ncbi:hypothetical protein CLCR_06488 [Cladophialophora carrionii]|uniref:Uncharacterized protein n=1 Tax=Cladophialophora carrionii TaxID=86049 RepID=A0A1C1C829_9EURO|nr:hypothetical protein CLCR_06488 [Cladophialophora carrionii]
MKVTERWTDAMLCRGDGKTLSKAACEQEQRQKQEQKHPPSSGSESHLSGVTLLSRRRYEYGVLGTPWTGWCATPRELLAT